MEIVIKDNKASSMNTNIDRNKKKYGRKLWSGFAYTISALAFGCMVALLVVILVGAVTTFKYGNILYCSGCGQSYVSNPGQDYCTTCGTKHSEDDTVDRYPYCLNCGKLEGFDHKVYCDKCGGLIAHNAKVKLSEIENPVVRFFVKRSF